MKIINKDDPQLAARLALEINGKAAELSEADVLKLGLALEITTPVFKGDLPSELAGVMVYEAVNKADVDGFVYVASDGAWYLIISTLALGADFPSLKYILVESVATALEYDPETDIDVVALAGVKRRKK